MKTIADILRDFDKNRDSLKLANRLNENTVANEAFLPCAKQILCDGYFLINDKYILDIKSIELYYHEDDGEIKDYVMYHTSCRYPTTREDGVISPLVERMGNKLPYFDFATIHLHTSGMDITFEDEGKAYRASFLIREYKIWTNNINLQEESIKYDDHSTHIFDDIFYLGIPINKPLKIEWVESDIFRDCIVKQTPRKNVAKEYIRNPKTLIFEKKPLLNPDDYRSDEFFRYGKKTYLKCTRPWRFTRVNPTK